jgi:hypothetical protein
MTAPDLVVNKLLCSSTLLEITFFGASKYETLCLLMQLSLPCLLFK